MYLCRLVLIFSLCLFLLSGMQRGMAKEIIGGSSKRYSLDFGFTTIDDEQETVFIDYDDRQLYRYDKKNRACTGYPLVFDKGRSAGELFRIGSFAEISILDGEDGQPSSPHKIRSLLFGRRAMLTRSAVDPEITWFGTAFRPGRVDYTLDSTHPDGSRIMEIAQANRSISGLHPLLDQIDTSRLTPLLGGVAVKEIKKKAVYYLEYQVIAKKAQREKLHRYCLTH